jgi:hypothetical protein
VKSNGQAELRRNYEELVNALRMLEEENKSLRAELERYRGKAPVQRRVEVVEVKRDLAPGQFVEYLPPGGKRGTASKAALVLEVKPSGALKLKVKHCAQPDEVLDDVGPERWRRRA